MCIIKLYSDKYRTYYKGEVAMNSVKLKNKCKGFTFAEVLITLGIIGVVAAVTMPIIVNKYQEQVYKTAYKKVYAELSEAVREAIFNQEFIRTSDHEDEATVNEFNIIKKKFKVSKECPVGNTFDCWVDADRVYVVDGREGFPIETVESFIDIAGRNWTIYYKSQNVFLVDTNGFKAPNQFGKDRWVFTFTDQNGRRAINFPEYKKVAPYAPDITEPNRWCQHPPCYYQSWLYK